MDITAMETSLVGTFQLVVRRDLRLLGKQVPSTYGPTADVTWEGADPTRTVQAAGRK